MNLQELNNWIDSAHLVDLVDSYNLSENKYGEKRIYEKGGKFYSIPFENGRPLEKFEKLDHDKGRPFGCAGIKKIKNEYNEPREVVRKTRIIEEHYYE